MGNWKKIPMGKIIGMRKCSIRQGKSALRSPSLLSLTEKRIRVFRRISWGKGRGRRSWICILCIFFKISHDSYQSALCRPDWTYPFPFLSSQLILSYSADQSVTCNNSAVHSQHCRCLRYSMKVTAKLNVYTDRRDHLTLSTKTVIRPSYCVFALCIKTQFFVVSSKLDNASNINN